MLYVISNCTVSTVMVSWCGCVPLLYCVCTPRVDMLFTVKFVGTAAV